MAPDSIILHCSATKDRRTVSWSAIRQYHMSWKCEGQVITAEAAYEMGRQGMPVTKPWADIGYHFGIEQINDSYEILMGRMPHIQGAHCHSGGMNHHSLGICFVGSFNSNPPPEPQWKLGLKLVTALMRIYKIPPEHVFGHREFASNKSCPGMFFDLDKFRNELCSLP
jgi:hypothetical protein